MPAGVAQLVEHLVAIQKVEGSNPFTRSNLPSKNFPKRPRYLDLQGILCQPFV